MRVSYWTGWLDPQMVAVSKEVHQLMATFPGSCAFGISPHYNFVASYRRRSWGVHPRFYRLVKPLMGMLERRFDISHVYTGLADWHFLNALGRRPIVLTVTQNGAAGHPKLLAKVSRVVAETDRLAECAVRSGVQPDKVSVVPPGIDLALFRPAPVPDLPWKCVFASSPESEAEIHTKGVDLLLAVAQQKPQVEFTLLWRPFGPAADQALARIENQAPPNVVIIKRRVPDMHNFLTGFHFAVAPFRSAGKPCPNSILEALALGRPALVSDYVDIGDVLKSHGAGITFARTEVALAEAIDDMCRNYDDYQRNARNCAERCFDFNATSAAYRGIYRSLIGE
jgi:glycosyltransferase involved in cell wall biosynthesis